MNIDLNECISKWTEENSANFPRFYLDRKSFVIVPRADFWKNDEIPDEISGFTASFFKNPPLAINYQTELERPKSITYSAVNNNLFVFGPALENNYSTKSLDEIMSESAPLGSVFPAASVHSFKDTRIQIKNNEQKYFDYSISFDSFEMRKQSVEPLFVFAFLYDTKEKKQVSDMFRMNCNNDARYANKEESQTGYFNIQNTENIVIVTSLARYLQKNGGEQFDEYYLDQSKTPPEKLIELSSKCIHERLYSTIGYAISKFPAGDETTVYVKQFIKTTTCSTSFLENALKSGEKSEEEVIFPISVKLKLLPVAPRSDFSMPFKHYKNDLCVKLGNSYFNLPTGVKGRNIFAVVSLVNKGKVIEEKTSMCQYHVEDPQFYDNFRFKLPGNLDESAKLEIRFYHAIVKGDVKGSRSECGAATIPLIKDGIFLDNGVHQLGISYPRESEPISQVPPKEDNRIFIETELSSIIYTNAKLCNTLFQGKYSEIVLPTTSEMLPLLYVIVDDVLERVKEGKSGAFKMLLKIVKLFTTTIETSPLLYYVRMLALRDRKQMSTMILKSWLKYMEHTFNPKRSDILCSWFLFELLTKSFALDPTKVDHLEEVMNNLCNYLPMYQEENRSHGLKLNKNMALFERDLFDIIDKNVATKIIQSHLSVLNTARAYDRTLFKDWMVQFFTPKHFVRFLIPINGTTLLNSLIIPKMKTISPDSLVFEPIFRHIFSILLKFEPNEQLFLIKAMLPFLSIIGSIRDIPRLKLVYTLTVGDFIAYNEELESFDQNIAQFANLILRCSIPGEIDAFGMNNSSSQNTEEEDSSDNPAQATRLRRGNSIFGRAPDLTWDALAFCSQAICIKWMTKFSNLELFNSIITHFLDTTIAVPLQPYYFEFTEKFFREHPDIAFSSKSNLKHLVRRILENPSSKSVDLLLTVYELEKQVNGNNNIMNSLIARAMNKCKDHESKEKYLNGTVFQEKYVQLKNALDDLSQATTGIKKAVIYDKIASLLKASPDSRVDNLLLLSDVLLSMQCWHEATLCIIHCLAIISENITLRTDRATIMKELAEFSPSVVDEKFSFEQTICGYCTSKLFSGFGFIEMIRRLFKTCESVPPLKSKLAKVFIPILQKESLYADISKLLDNLSSEKIAEDANTIKAKRSEYFLKKLNDGKSTIIHLSCLHTLEEACKEIDRIFAFDGADQSTSENVSIVSMMKPNEFFKDEQKDPFSIQRTVFTTDHCLPSILPFSDVSDTKVVDLTKEDSIEAILSYKAEELLTLIDTNDDREIQTQLLEIFSHKNEYLKKDPHFDEIVIKAVSHHGEWSLDHPEDAEIHDDFEAAILDL